MKKLLNDKRGFTLVEIIIAIAVIGLVVTAATELTQSSLRIGGSTLKKFAALRLAEEGVEIVRNMRDSNWLRNKQWLSYFPSSGSSTYAILRQTIPSDETGLWRLNTSSDDERIRLGNHEFRRTVEISLPPANNPQAPMRVKSKVSYLERGERKEIELAAEFMDWKKGPL